MKKKLCRRAYMSAMRTPLGWLCAASDEDNLLRVHLPGEHAEERLQKELYRMFGLVEIQKGGRVLSLFFNELSEYFQGKRFAFETPTSTRGTAFQQRVWKAVSRIPFGETRSYAWVAAQAGSPGAARAVGQANGSNPLPVIVPCHRVISADGSLGGFSSGVHVKQWLLEWEKGQRDSGCGDALRKGTALHA